MNFFFLFRLGIDFLFNVVHAFLELRYAFAQATHEFWNFLASEEKEDDEEDDDELPF